MSTSRSALLTALNLAKPAIGRPLFVPVLANFCLTGREVIAYDDAIGISINHELPVKCAVPADLLLRLLNSLSSDDLNLDQGGGFLKVACGRTALKLPAMEPAAFIFRPSFGDPDFTFKVVDDFINGIDSCLMSVGVDPTHAAQLGITLVSNGKRVSMFSTDNATMSRYRVDMNVYENAGTDNEKVVDRNTIPSTYTLMPTEFCRQLSSMRKEDEETTIAVYDSAIVATFGKRGLLYAKLIDNDRPLDFEKVFASKVPEVAEDEKDPFLPLPPAWDSTFERACALADPTHPTTELQSDGVEITSTTTSPFGEVIDVLEVKTPKRRPFLIDPEHIMRATRLCSQFAFFPDVFVMRKNKFTHIVTHCTK